MLTGILLAALIVGGTGIFIGFFLGFSGEKLKVESDPREEEILNCLPGNNCGGCGYAGCAGLAAAIAKGEAEVGGCPVGGTPVSERVAEIMGVEAAPAARKTAFVACAGTCGRAKQAYAYYGEEDCAMLAFVPGGGPKTCNYGCAGYGSCVKVCPFDAIHVVEGVAVVDREACKACGRCVAACPKHLITLVPYKAGHKVRCASRGKGKAVMDACGMGCIGCGLCQRSCPAGAVTVEDNLARIDYEKCTGCGLCAEKCPRKIITVA